MLTTPRLASVATSVVVSLAALAGCANGDPVTQDGQISGFGGADGSGGDDTGSTSGSTSGHSTSTSGATSGGATSGGATPGGTGGGTSGGATSGGGTQCVDDGEPGDGSESGAIDLGSVNDCDWNGGSVVGTLSGPSDVDWFYYSGDDVAGCTVDPQRIVSSSARLCAFFECASGSTEVACPDGTAPETSPEGRPGCCGQNTGQSFQIGDLNCAWTVDDDVFVYLRIDNPDGLECVDYGVEFHY